MNSRPSTDCLDKHTPGPWKATSTGPRMEAYSQPFGIVQSGKPNLIAGVFGDVRGGMEVAEGNARMIAAAPDLLAACEKAKKFLEPDLVEPGRTVFWQLVEAIRKAKGDA